MNESLAEVSKSSPLENAMTLYDKTRSLSIAVFFLVSRVKSRSELSITLVTKDLRGIRRLGESNDGSISRPKTPNNSQSRKFEKTTIDREEKKAREWIEVYVHDVSVLIGDTIEVGFSKLFCILSFSFLSHARL